MIANGWLRWLVRKRKSVPLPSTRDLESTDSGLCQEIEAGELASIQALRPDEIVREKHTADKREDKRK